MRKFVIMELASGMFVHLDINGGGMSMTFVPNAFDAEPWPDAPSAQDFIDQRLSELTRLSYKVVNAGEDDS